VSRRSGRALAAAFAALLLPAAPALAGPPYVTDDPEPTRTGGWENYVYVSGTNVQGGAAGQAGVELNYGGAKDLQLSASLPLNFDTGGGGRIGGGDVDLGAKYRFLHADDHGWRPDVAIFPALSLPSGARALDTGHPSLFLPVWAEKDFGKWSVFGGGGYDLNPGRGLKDYTLSGVALTRAVSRRLNLGVELYHQTPATVGGPALTNLGFGAIYQLTRHWALMASGGPGLQSPVRAGASAFYASLQFTN
jgi:hypothetical protein